MNNHSIDPLKFLELNKSEILFILRKEMRYTEEKACLKFDLMTDVIVKLKPLRACKLQTIDYLEEIIQQLSPKVKSFMVNFLLKAMEHDDSYGYAFNFLAHVANRYQLVPIPLKTIDEHELLALLEKEMIDAVKTGSVRGIQKKLSLQKIALQYVWEGKLINKGDCDQIARSFGYRSGAKLYQHYTLLSKRANRVADPDSSRTVIDHKIVLFESVIEGLPVACKAKALEELQTLKEIQDKKYLGKTGF